MKKFSKYGLVFCAMLLIIVLPPMYANANSDFEKGLYITLAGLSVVGIILFGLFLAFFTPLEPTQELKSYDREPPLQLAQNDKKPIVPIEPKQYNQLEEPVPEFLRAFLPISRITNMESYLQSKLTETELLQFQTMIRVAEPVIVETIEGKKLDAIWPNKVRSRVPDNQANYWLWLISNKD